jgi:hypothetical protein
VALLVPNLPIAIFDLPNSAMNRYFMDNKVAKDISRIIADYAEDASILDGFEEHCPAPGGNSWMTVVQGRGVSTMEFNANGGLESTGAETLSVGVCGGHPCVQRLDL